MATPTYSESLLVAVGTTMTPDAVPSHRRFITDSNGNMWFWAPYSASGADWTAVRAYYSDDNGATWNYETIEDSFGATANEGLWQGILVEAENGDIVCIQLTDTASHSSTAFRVLRRTGTNTWVEQASFTPRITAPITGLPHCNMAAFNHPDDTDRWIVLWGDASGGSSAGGYSYVYSEDDLSTWNAVQTGHDSPVAQDETTDLGGFIAVSDDTKRRIHILYTLVNSSSNHYLHSAHFTGWDNATPPAAASAAVVLGPVNNANGQFRNFAFSWLTSTTGEFQWSEGNNSTSIFDGRRAIATFTAGLTPAVTLGSSASILLYTYGTESGPDSMYVDQDGEFVGGRWRVTRTIWQQWYQVDVGDASASTWIDSDAMWYPMNTTMDYHSFGADGPSDGVIGIMYGEKTSNVFEYRILEGSNIAYYSVAGGLPGASIPAAETLYFTEVASSGGIAVQIDSGSTSVNKYGGRKNTRSAAGRLWHAYVNNTLYPVAAYSDDGGLTWTTVTVEGKQAIDGIAVCIGSGDNAVVAYSRNQKIRFLQWNGSSFVLLGTKSTGTKTTQSFQVMYDGSTYHVVYGDKSSAGSRRVRHSTSSNLSSFSTSTIASDGNANAKPFDGRRVAACLDESGNVHAFYSGYSSSSWRLYYDMYNGTWTGAVQIRTSSKMDFEGLSCAKQFGQNPQVTFLGEGFSLTNRKQVWLAQKPASSWFSQVVSSSSADANQGYPSIQTTNVDTYVFWRAYQHSEGAGLVWTLSTLARAAMTTDTSPFYFDTWDGPDGANSQKLSRGYNGTFQSTEEFFELGGAEWLDSVTAAETLSFSESSALQGFPFAEETLNLSEAAVQDTSKLCAETLNFSEAAFVPIEETLTEQFSLVENAHGFLYVLGEKNAFGLEGFSFNEAAGREVGRFGDAAESLSFSELAGNERLGTATETLSFSEEIGLQFRANKVAAETLSFAEVASEIADINLSESETLTFTEGTFYLPVEGCETNFTPSPAIPDDENSILYVYLAGPFGDWGNAVRLKRPDYGNTRKSALQTIVQRSRGGVIRLFKRNPTYKQLTVTWSGLTRKKLLEVEAFLEATKAEFIRYVDENGHVWKCFVLNENVDYAKTATDRGGEVSLLLEGSVTGAIS